MFDNVNDKVHCTDTARTDNNVGSNFVNDRDRVHNTDCDHVDKKDNANSIKAIVDTIHEVKMHGFLYIHDDNNNDCGNDLNDDCDCASLTNNFKLRVEPVPGTESSTYLL